MIELPLEIINGTGVRLRLPRESDADDIAAACADPVSLRYLPMLPIPYTRADALMWITEGSGTAWASGGAAFVIVNPETDRVIGATGIGRVAGGRQQGEVGYWVAPWARGTGVARAAVVALTDWAFAYGFSRLELLTELENSASQRVALAAGYRRESVRRSAARSRDGSRHDLVAFVRLAEDPPGPVPRALPDLPDGQLTDGVVTLRPLRTEDAEQVLRLHTEPDVYATAVPPAAPERTAVVRRCAWAQSHWLAGERASLAILDAASGSFAGDLSLFHHEPETRQAMVGYSLLPEHRGRGFTTRAVSLLARWVFADTDIVRLVAGVATWNVASQRVLERAGFQREGVQRSRLPGVDGTRVDEIGYARLATDPPPG